MSIHEKKYSPFLPSSSTFVQSDVAMHFRVISKQFFCAHTGQREQGARLALAILGLHNPCKDYAVMNGGILNIFNNGATVEFAIGYGST